MYQYFHSSLKTEGISSKFCVEPEAWRVAIRFLFVLIIIALQRGSRCSVREQILELGATNIASQW